MIWFVMRRLAALLLLLLIISLGIFALQDLAPGDAAQTLLGGARPTPEALDAVRAKHHLDDPFLVQYGRWLADAATLDFGTSLRTGEPVTSSLRERFGLTMTLGAYAFLIAVLLAVPLGTLAAVKARSGIDRGVVAGAVVGVSTPPFVSGIFLLYVFAVELGWFPAFGVGEGFADRIWHLTLPALALALTAIALIVRVTRTAMMDALSRDYVAFARARGVPARAVLVGYGLRNALIPIVTASGLVLASMLTGAVLVEVAFALPGAGSLLVESIRFNDVPMVQALTLVAAAVLVLVNLVVDLLYLAIDPRVRFEKVPA